MARIFTDEELERENARHVLVFAEQQRRGSCHSFEQALGDTLPAHTKQLLVAALNVGMAVGVASAKHRATRAGLNAAAIIDGIPDHRPFMRPLGPTGGVPDDMPVSREPEVVQMGDLPEPVPMPARHLDDQRPGAR